MQVTGIPPDAQEIRAGGDLLWSLALLFPLQPSLHAPLLLPRRRRLPRGLGPDRLKPQGLLRSCSSESRFWVTVLAEDIWVMDDRDDSPERGEWNPDPEEDQSTRVVSWHGPV